MPTLCFGGSFNPIHNGHMRCAQAVAESAGYDRVLLIPSSSPPHKPDQAGLAPASDRLTMCRLAAEGSDVLEVSDIETRRSGPSYTIDTVRQFNRQGSAKTRWLIGADMLMYLPRWHRIDELLNEVHFVVMRRPGVEIDWSKLPARFAFLKDHIVNAPLVDMSATEIRRRVRSGEPIDDLVPANVARYIADRGLYRSNR